MVTSLKIIIFQQPDIPCVRNHKSMVLTQFFKLRKCEMLKDENSHPSV